MIEIKNLKASYGKNQVLNGINLQIQPGEITGIVGLNGAGKSTFFNCLANLVNSQGEILSAYKPLRNHLGLLETNPSMLSMITGEEYLILHCNAKKIPIPNFSESNPFLLPLKKYASTYSTGMKKKLAMTALLLMNQPIYILDEPFNGVDLKSNLQLTDMILDLKSKGKIIIISSHIFSTLAEICDQIHFLNQGVIQASSHKKPFSEIENLLR